MKILSTLFFTLTLFSAGVNPLSANIDPIQEPGIEQIAPGVYARAYAAEDIRSLNATQFQEVIDLYHTFQPPKKGFGSTTVENDCFALQIKTKKDFADFRIKQEDFPDIKTENGISVLEFFFIKNEACTSKQSL